MSKKQKEQFSTGEVVIYKPKKGSIELRVKIERQTVWLDARQMAKIFGVNRPAVVKHIGNIYKAGELEKELTCSILEQVAKDGKIRKVNLYNLDMIISVGYRVNSQQATQFRIWATKILRDYLLERGIKQSDFAITLDTGRAHLSCVISGTRKAGPKLARSIERATNGDIKAEDILSGKAVGYEGKPKRVAPSKVMEKLLREEKTSCRKVFSLL